MNLTARFATTMSVAVLLALGVPGGAKEKATEKTVSAPEAPLSKGYETAIAAHATKLSPSSCQCRAGLGDRTGTVGTTECVVPSSQVTGS